MQNLGQLFFAVPLCLCLLFRRFPNVQILSPTSQDVSLAWMGMFSCYSTPPPRPISTILHPQEKQKYAGEVPVGCRVRSRDCPVVGGSCSLDPIFRWWKEQEERFILSMELCSSRSPAALSSWEYFRIEADPPVWEKGGINTECVKGVVCCSPAVHQFFSGLKSPS